MELKQFETPHISSNVPHRSVIKEEGFAIRTCCDNSSHFHSAMDREDYSNTQLIDTSTFLKTELRVEDGFYIKDEAQKYVNPNFHSCSELQFNNHENPRSTSFGDIVHMLYPYIHERKIDRETNNKLDSSDATRRNCNQCEYTTTNKRSFQRHLLFHRPEKHLKCSQCDYTTIDRYCLKRHMNVHANEKQFKCDQCDYGSIDQYRLKRHKTTHLEEKFVCNTCGFSCRDLQKHQKTHQHEKPYKCTLCEFATKWPGSLELHSRTHTGEKPFLCTYCGHRTAYHRHLKVHQMRHHFQAQPPLKCTNMTKKPSSLTVKSYKCEICTFSTTRGSSLKIHLRMHTGEKPYVCNECGHRTAYKSHLKLHQNRKHLGNRPYKCSLCDYSAAAKSQLNRHLSVHIKNGA